MGLGVRNGVENDPENQNPHTRNTQRVPRQKAPFLSRFRGLGFVAIFWRHRNQFKPVRVPHLSFRRCVILRKRSPSLPKGSKAIYVANACRTLQTIGWRHAEPVLRSLAFALLEHEGDNPAKRDADPDRPLAR